MNISSRPSILGIGLAIFSMFFGAGNSIFPLFVGYIAQGDWILAYLGLLFTAVVMPLLGIIGMLRSGGAPLRFFGRIGKVPGLFIALFVISLLGPLGSTPRCIALAYATLVDGGQLSMPFFGFLVTVLLFFCSLKKKLILPLIGYVLTPILLLSLLAIIFVGLLNAPSFPLAAHTQDNAFIFGLFEGYKTMDLLAAFFFSSTILHLLKTQGVEKEKKAVQLLFQGGLIGGGLLALVYGGFCYIASIHASSLGGVPQELLLRRIAEILLGGSASIIVKIAIALACLTTAIALITAFVDFLHSEITKGKVSYPLLLGGSLLLTYGMATFEFTSISKMLSPILSILYPGLILLTLYNCTSLPEKSKI